MRPGHRVNLSVPSARYRSRFCNAMAITPLVLREVMKEAQIKLSNRMYRAVSFLKLAASGNVSEAYANYISPTFRHHNPYFAGDAESLKKGMAEAAAKFPNTMLEGLRCSTFLRRENWLPFTLECNTGPVSRKSPWFTFSALKAIGLRSCGTWARLRRLTRQISMGCSEATQE